MTNGNLYPILLTGIWFRLHPYLDELYFALGAELIVDGEVVESWLIREVPHTEVRRFSEPFIVNADSDYFVRLAFLEAFELARDTEFFAGFTYEPDSPVAEVLLHPVAFLST